MHFGLAYEPEDGVIRETYEAVYGGLYPETIIGAAEDYPIPCEHASIFAGSGVICDIKSHKIYGRVSGVFRSKRSWDPPTSIRKKNVS